MAKIKGHAALLQISDFSLGRGLYIAKALSLAGLSVTIITNKPIFGSLRPSSRDIISFSEPKIIELRIPFAKVLYRSIFGRLLFYLFLTAFSFLRLFVDKPQPKLLYSRGPQPFTEISCFMYKIFRNTVAIVSDITDLWPDAVRYLEIGNTSKTMLIGIGNAINSFVYSKINSVVTLNEELAKLLEHRLKLKPCIIYGVIDLEKFKPRDKIEALKTLPEGMQAKLAGKFVILYAGLLGPFQNPMVISEIAKKVADIPDVMLVVIGEGPLKGRLVQELKKQGLNNMLFLETQPFERMPLIYNLADMCILTYAPYDLLRVGLPKKFIEYSASGKPILCLSPPCVASRLCLDWAAGFHVYPQEIEEAVRIISALKADPTLEKNLGRNSRLMAENLFSLRSAAEKLTSLVTDQEANCLPETR